MTDDRILKQRAVRGLLTDDRRTILLTQPETLAWYLDGARVTIAMGGPPIVAVAISADDEAIFCFDNEHARMIAEELPGGARVIPVPWYGSLADAARAASSGVELDTTIAADLRVLRRTLLPEERARFALLGAEAAAVLTDALAEARPEHTERELAARIAGAVVALGAEPLVTLVAGEPRLPHRHPVPTGGVLGHRAMAVVCARRHGMITNVTRWVQFGPPSAAEADAERRILDVEAGAFAATRPGRTLGDVLADIADAYVAAGFDRDEWRRHHQGGPAGYLGRDPRATPGETAEVAAGQAFSWNPTAPGVKVEDTVVIDADGRVDALTVDPRWPTVTVDGRARPATLTH